MLNDYSFKLKKEIGRNPKCDRHRVKVQRKKRNKSPKRKGEMKVQKEYGKRRINLKKQTKQKNPKTTM